MSGKSSRNSRRRVDSAHWTHSQRPLCERLADHGDTATERRLKILAESTGHTPEDLLRRGWFKADIDLLRL